MPASQRLIEAEPRTRIGASNDEEVRSLARSDGNTNLGHHVFDRYDATVRGVTALLGKLLVFDLDGADARTLIAAHRMLHVEQAAKTRIGIGYDRCRRFLDDLANSREHVGIGRKTRIRNAEIRGRQPKARGIDGIEADPLGQHGGNHVEDTGCHDELTRVQFVLQTCIGHGAS